jgi:hypothetical protein
MRLDVLLAATNDDVIAGFDRGELISIAALVVSVGAAFLSVHTWRRAPGSTLELRNFSVDRDEAGQLRFSCIARNRSPHAVAITRGHVRCRPAMDQAVGASISLGPISFGGDVRDTGQKDDESVISVDLGLAGISVSRASGRGEAVVAVVVEVDLVPEGASFPATIPPSQGLGLHGGPVRAPDESLASIGRLTFEVSTNDGLTFSKEVPMPDTPANPSQSPTTPR